MILKTFIAILPLLLVGWLRAGNVPAFPGAEGFGAKTKGGRGGQLIAVTNLNDSGPGSFRQACETAGPRIITFHVGGTIRLKKRIEIHHPNLTIAGQTAPGGGICLSIEPETADGGPLKIMTSEVIIRHLRFRPGPAKQPEVAENVDGLTIADRNGPIRRVIIDHCSFSWATDELFNTWYDVADITVQWCLFSEALAKSDLVRGSHSKGPLLGSRDGERQSFHHNLMIHNAGRNPMVKMSGLADIVNNVAHVPRMVAMSVSDEYGAARANFVANYVSAPNADGFVYGCVFLKSGNGFSVYAAGNMGPHSDGSLTDATSWFRNRSPEYFAVDRHPAPPITEHTALQARQLLFAKAGATLPQRDLVDQRVVAEAKEGITRVVTHPADVGGWPQLERGLPPLDSDKDGFPDSWEDAYGFDPRSTDNPSVDSDSDGFTDYEEYLNGTHPYEPDPN